MGPGIGRHLSKVEVILLTKSVVLSHGDLDGITSGAIALLKFPGSTFYFTRPSQIHQDLFRVAKDKPDIVHISAPSPWMA
jgi:hypothetical protein